MPVLRNIGRLLTCRPGGGQAEVLPVEGAALAFRDGRVTWVGRERDLPAREDDGERWDAQGRLVMPGLVDAHTHLAFGGWRVEDFVARIRGESYLRHRPPGRRHRLDRQEDARRHRRGAVRPLPRLPAGRCSRWA